jgi:ketosteroid isomerase-like protein
MLNQRGRSKATGVPVEMRFAQVWTVRDGLGIRMQMFANPEEALEAVGLSEDAMSQENYLDIVRRHFADTNARRFDAALLAYDPDVELVVSEEVAVDPGTYRGVDAVGEWFGSWFRTFASDYRMDFVELVPVNDAVVATVDHRGVGRRSGVEVTTRYYNVYWFRENRIVRLGIFRERSEALEAVVESII